MHFDQETIDAVLYRMEALDPFDVDEHAIVKPITEVRTGRPCRRCLTNHATVAPNGDWLCDFCGAVGNEHIVYNDAFCRHCRNMSAVETSDGIVCYNRQCKTNEPPRLRDYVLGGVVLLALAGMLGAALWLGMRAAWAVRG